MQKVKSLKNDNSNIATGDLELIDSTIYNCLHDFYEGNFEFEDGFYFKDWELPHNDNLLSELQCIATDGFFPFESNKGGYTLEGFIYDNNYIDGFARCR